MKYLILVHHDEEAFEKISETKRKELLAESVQLTHQLHDNGQYVHASPLHPAAVGHHRTGARRQTVRHRRSLRGNARATRRLLPD